MKHQIFDQSGRLTFEVDVDANLVRRWDDSGSLVEQRVLTLDETADASSRQQDLDRSANQRAIISAAKTALATNTAFVGLASPSSAQVTAEVRALARQNNRIIRLLLSQLGDRSQLDATD